MTTLVKAGTIEAQTSAMDLVLRTAEKLKGARGLLPETLKTEGEIVAVLLAGQELGIPPMAALRGLQVVRGKVIISYDTMIALLRRASYRVEWLESTQTKAVLRLTSPDGSTHVETWDQDRAKRAGLWGKGTWSQYPETMLRARCVSSGARAFAGEVLSGVYVEGEIDASRPSPTVTVESAGADVAAEPPIADAEVVSESPGVDPAEVAIVVSMLENAADQPAWKEAQAAWDPHRVTASAGQRKTVETAARAALARIKAAAKAQAEKEKAA